MYGYAGEILRVDLDNHTITKEPLNMEEARKFVGGRAFGVKMLLDENKPGIDPLSPENKLIILTSPITGVSVPGNARFIVLSKSPQTGMYGECQSGGDFGPQLKRAGFDGIIFEGKSSSPVYLYVHDGEAELKKADHLWGTTTSETAKQIKADLNNEKVAVASIGQAGEKLVKFASIYSEDHVAARTGMAAVMGSKNLKAVAALGSNKIEVADPETIKQLRTDIVDKINNDWFAGFVKKHGTNGGLHYVSKGDVLPTRNYQTGVFKNADQIGGETLYETFEMKSTTCFACPIRCKKFIKWKDDWITSPEYESAAALGSICGIEDFETLLKANIICNDYGVDAISAGMTIGFAMELYERGLITVEDTDGLELKFGNNTAFLTILQQIVDKEGFGKVLSEGSRAAARKIGRGSEEYAMQVKGLELAMHDPRPRPVSGLSYATANVGGSHSECKGQEIKTGQDLASVLESLVMCSFTLPGISQDFTAKLLSAVTGWDITGEELLLIGERATNLGRVFNIREGQKPGDDQLPERFFTPIPEGRVAGTKLDKVEFQQQIQDYYKNRGWDSKGKPTKKTLTRLGLIKYLIQ